jgi:CRISPR system Cascade subunit CasE
VARAPGADCEAKVYDPRISAGQRLRFDLMAQVTVDRDGKRRDPVLEARIAEPASRYDEIAQDLGTDWLRRREESAGFRAEELHTTEYDVLDFVRPQDRRHVRLGVIRFTGILRCLDSDRMRRTLLSGLGHGKAWGCGLLLVAR